MLTPGAIWLLTNEVYYAYYRPRAYWPYGFDLVCGGVRPSTGACICGGGAVETPSVHVGLISGGRWCDAYPLGFDLVTVPLRPIYLLLLVVLVVALVLTYGDR